VKSPERVLLRARKLAASPRSQRENAFIAAACQDGRFILIEFEFLADVRQRSGFSTAVWSLKASHAASLRAP